MAARLLGVGDLAITGKRGRNATGNSGRNTLWVMTGTTRFSGISDDTQRRCGSMSPGIPPAKCLYDLPKRPNTAVRSEGRDTLTGIERLQFATASSISGQRPARWRRLWGGWQSDLVIVTTRAVMCSAADNGLNYRRTRARLGAPGSGGCAADFNADGQSDLVIANDTRVTFNCSNEWLERCCHQDFKWGPIVRGGRTRGFNGDGKSTW